jgi:cyanophycin synthetase
VFENGPDTILDQGLVYDRCSIGVVTDLEGAQALGRHDIHEADDLPRVLRTQMDVVLGSGFGVLNADDARVAALAEYCDGSVLLYATQASVLAGHREAGGRAVLARDGRLWLCEGTAETPLPPLRSTHPPALAVLLPAITAAWAFGLAPALLAAGIDTFDAQTSA